MLQVCETYTDTGVVEYEHMSFWMFSETNFAGKT